MRIGWWSRRDRLVVPAGVVVPFVVCVILVPFRTSVPNTDAALILLAAVVAVAAYGNRLAGVLAALSGAVWFDFFLTAPYERLSIAARYDIETFVLLVVVGLAVTELAVRGRRSRLLAVTDERYLDAIRTTNELATSHASDSDVTDHACAQLTALLRLRGCRFEATRFGGLPRMESDGDVHDAARDWDVEQHGLPDSDIEVLASAGGRMWGRFVLTPVPGVIPPLAARKSAVVVVGLAAAALTTNRQPQDR